MGGPPVNFASYDAFRIAIQWLIEGEEMTGTFSVNTLDLMIGLGEARVHDGDNLTPGLRASSMLVQFADADPVLTVTDNAVALPADLLELQEVYFDGEPPVEIVGRDRLRNLLASGSTTGTVRYAAQVGDTLTFWPQASGDLLGSYYAKPAPLATITWADATTFARYPQLYLYAALYEAALFLGMTSRLGAWESRYRQLAHGAMASERARTWNGSPLRIRSR